VLVRRAAPSDGPSLLALTGRCPMHAAVSLAIEREPDFFALSRARGCARTLIAEADGLVIACAGIARRPAWVGGRLAEVAYLADLKVAPEHRGGGLGARLVEAVLAEEARGRPAPLLATVAAGNRPADRLAGRYAAVVGLSGIVDVVCLQLFAARASRRVDIELGRARPEDEAELGALLDEFYRERQFAPVFGDGGFEEILRRSPGLALSDHLVARRGGRILATVALWDQGSFKRVRVLRVTPTLRLGLGAIAIAARVLPVPVLPPTGELLRLAFLRHPAYAAGEEAALAALLRTAIREASAAGHHFAVLTAPRGDPVARCARGIPRLTYRYRLLVGATAPLAEPSSLKGRVTFDDAALS
jgi:N-acetylglutamate synthase-like GNAT family acetyltransferase